MTRSRVPARSVCAACNKGNHGMENCRKGTCSCKCKEMSPGEVDTFRKNYNEGEEFNYSKESDEAFEKLMAGWRKDQSEKQPNIQRLKTQ